MFTLLILMRVYMHTDFYNAFFRHATDADLLLDKKRWANADHLYGLAAECALKKLLQLQGIKTKDDGSPKKYKYRVHINKLWDAYPNFMQTRDAYTIPEENPFLDWDIAQRYTHEKDITEQMCRNHCAAVNILKKILRKAMLFDGRIEDVI